MKRKQSSIFLLIFVLGFTVPLSTSAQFSSFWELLTKTPPPIFKNPQRKETNFNLEKGQIQNFENLPLKPNVGDHRITQDLLTPPSVTTVQGGDRGDMIHVFFRCMSPHNLGVLCRIKGPANVDQWNSPEGREKGYGVKIFENIPISSAPVAIYDSKSKIHVFAPRHTGDLGGAFGLQYFRCEIDSLDCAAASNLILESKVHFKPSLILVKGQRPEEDFIMGFYHGGYGGQLGVFRVNVNNLGISNQWVHDHLSDSGKESCSQHANIDKSPSAQLVARNGGSEIHLWARAGHGNPLHLWLRSEEFNKMIAGEDYRYNCEKSDWEGKPRFHGSPTALIDGDQVTIFATHRADFVTYAQNSMVAWFGFLDPEDSSWQIQREVAGIQPDFGSGAKSVQQAPEEAPSAILVKGDPGGNLSYMEVFFNYQNRFQEPNNQMNHEGFTVRNATGEDRDSFLFLARIGKFGTTALDTPVAVRDTMGNAHVFSASPMNSTTHGNAPIFHWKLINNDPGSWRDIRATISETYPEPEMIAHPHGAEDVAGTGRSGMSVVYIPQANPPGVDVVPTQTLKEGVNLNLAPNTQGIQQLPQFPIPQGED